MQTNHRPHRAQKSSPTGQTLSKSAGFAKAFPKLIYNENLTTTEKMALIAIRAHDWLGGRGGWPSNATLAKACGFKTDGKDGGARRVRALLAGLERDGYIRTEQVGATKDNPTGRVIFLDADAIGEQGTPGSTEPPLSHTPGSTEPPPPALEVLPPPALQSLQIDSSEKKNRIEEIVIPADESAASLREVTLSDDDRVAVASEEERASELQKLLTQIREPISKRARCARINRAGKWLAQHLWDEGSQAKFCGLLWLVARGEVDEAKVVEAFTTTMARDSRGEVGVRGAYFFGAIGGLEATEALDEEESRLKTSGSTPPRESAPAADEDELPAWMNRPEAKPGPLVIPPPPGPSEEDLAAVVKSALEIFAGSDLSRKAEHLCREFGKAIALEAIDAAKRKMKRQPEAEIAWSYVLVTARAKRKEGGSDIKARKAKPTPRVSWGDTPEGRYRLGGPKVRAAMEADPAKHGVRPYPDDLWFGPNAERYNTEYDARRAEAEKAEEAARQARMETGRRNREAYEAEIKARRSTQSELPTVSDPEDLRF